MFNIYVGIVENLHPFSLLSQVKNELQGYRDCVTKGPNGDKLPPKDLKEGEEFYRWSYWKNCSILLKKKTWTTNKFKEAAIKQYISIAKKYVSRLRA
jgi:hypothetical protein